MILTNDHEPLFLDVPMGVLSERRAAIDTLLDGWDGGLIEAALRRYAGDLDEALGARSVTPKPLGARSTIQLAADAYAADEAVTRAEENLKALQRRALLARNAVSERVWEETGTPYGAGLPRRYGRYVVTLDPFGPTRIEKRE